MRSVIKLAKILVIVVGLLALLHVVCLLCRQPLVRLVQVTGHSMVPTSMPGDRVLFVRKPWRINSIVLADVGEDAPVIKRVAHVTDGDIFLAGDNREQSQTYVVSSDQILGVMLWQVPLKLPCCEAR